MFHAVAQYDRKHCGAVFNQPTTLFPDISEL
jgi:hypothetical protein